MPLNTGKLNTVSKPSWLKDTPSATSSSSSPSPTARTWQRKTSTGAKKDETATETPSKPTVKEEEAPKKEVTAKLQSREIKVPLKVEKTIKPTSILKKPDPKPTEVKKEPEKTAVVIEKKPPTKLGSKSPSTTPSKSLSTTPSKSPTPSKTPPSKSSTPSKSPSKTPETYSDSDEDEESEEESEETETETETESEEEEEEIDSDEFDFSDNEPYRPPSPVNSKQKLVIPALRKVKKSPEPEPEKRSKSPEFTFKKPELKKVLTKEKSEVRERSQSPEPKFFKPKLRKVPSSLRTKNLPSREKLPVVELKRAPSKQMDMEPKKSTEAFPLKPSILRAESSKKIPLPPPPPPPPPPPGLKPPPDFEKKPISQKHRETIEKLKSRPRRRPDWSEMMKEVEEGKKLRHVQCNDRSSPIVTCKSMTKVQGQYVFETEKKNTALDKLLHEIQSGVKLRPTKTNDRSKPVLDGLRKFRRQMTIEEQIQKSESKAVLNTENVQTPLPDDEDELDDIDRVRDDLQSTKQMLALELRNKEAQERENKRLLAKIALLEAELQQARSGIAVEPSIALSNGSTDDVLIKNLKKETEEAQKTSKLLEKKYHEAAEQLDNAQKEIEEQKRYIMNLEKKLNTQDERGYTYNEGGDLESRRQSEAQQKESSPEVELVLSEEEEDETEEQKAERLARRLKREVDMLHTKLSKLKEKEMNARNERKSLRDAMKKNQQILKDEKKKFKKLQKEVEKMAAMMKAVEEECSDEDVEEPEELEEEEEDESEAESEESESESESETESQSEDEDADDQKKKENLEPRVKRHDGRLSSLKKGNYLLEANVERLKDEIKDHKEKCAALQADLDSVIDLC